MSTALATLIGALGISNIAGEVDPGALIGVDWRAALLMAGAAGLISLAKAVLAGLSGLGEPGTPSLVRTSGRHVKADQ